MSYCRFSSDGFKSNVYVYAGSNYVLHVASQKKVGVETLPPHLKFPSKDEDWPEYFRKYDEWYDAFDALGDSYRPIGLPHDGATFEFDTLEELKEMLVYLKELGYYVPSQAFTNIDADINS